MENENEVSADELSEKTIADNSEPSETADENTEKCSAESEEADTHVLVGETIANFDDETSEKLADDEQSEQQEDKSLDTEQNEQIEDDEQCGDIAEHNKAEELTDNDEQTKVECTNESTPAIDEREDNALQSDDVDAVNDVPIGESTPEKNQNTQLDLLTLISSPSETEVDESANNEKSWSQSQLNESISEDISGDESMEEEEMDSDEEERLDDKRHRSAVSNQKDNENCVYEVDDNSSEDGHSVTDDDDIDEQEDDDDIEEEEVDDDNSSDSIDNVVQTIDDSDDEPIPIVRSKHQSIQRQSYDQPSSHKKTESRLSATTVNVTMPNPRHFIKTELLRKRSASIFHRYNAVKRSVK